MTAGFMGWYIQNKMQTNTLVLILFNQEVLIKIEYIFYHGVLVEMAAKKK